MFREGLRQAVETDDRFALVGEADRGQKALELIERIKPDVAVLDVNLPELSGLDIAAILESRKSRVQLALLTMLKDETVFNKALNLGVKGYMLKDNTPAEILNCLEAVARGEAHVSPALTELLLRRRGRADALGARQPGLEDLTTAERRILKRIAAGQTSKQIAQELFVSPRTVETHRANICAKLELSGSNRLLQFALENRDALAHLD